MIVKLIPLSAPPLVAVRYFLQARRTNTEKPEGLLHVVVVVSFDYHLARDMRGHDHPLILAVERAISHSVTAAVIDMG